MVLHGGMGVPGLVCRVRLGRAEEQGLREKVTAMVPQIKQHMVLLIDTPRSVAPKGSPARVPLPLGRG